MKRHFLLFGLLLTLFSACKKTSFNSSLQATIDDNKIKAYIAANHIDVTKDPSGIYYQLVKLDTGSAHPSVTDTVQVTYTGKLLNGTVFDTEVATNLAMADVIQGWKIAIPKMTYDGSHVNFSRLRLIVPSALAYGNTSGGTVPANSVLDFQIDLIGYYPYP